MKREIHYFYIRFIYNMPRAYRREEILKKYSLIRHKDDPYLPYTSYVRYIFDFNYFYNIPVNIMHEVYIEMGILYKDTKYTNEENDLEDILHIYKNKGIIDYEYNIIRDKSMNMKMFNKNESEYIYRISANLYNENNHTKQDYTKMKTYKCLLNDILKKVSYNKKIT